MGANLAPGGPTPGDIFDCHNIIWPQMPMVLRLRNPGLEGFCGYVPLLAGGGGKSKEYWDTDKIKVL